MAADEDVRARSKRICYSQRGKRGTTQVPRGYAAGIRTDVGMVTARESQARA